MKRNTVMRWISIFLIFCSSVYASNMGAVVGGSSADVGNGIFFNSDLIAAAQNVKANGAVIKADVGVTYDHAGNGNGDRNFAKAGIGTDAIVGMYALVTGTNITSGYYEITAIAGDDSWVNCANITATGDNADSTLDIGGACPIVGAGHSVGDFDLQDVLDDALGDAAANDVDIFIAVGATLSATVDIDAGGGTATTRKSIIAVNTSYADDGTQITLTAQAAAGLANGMFEFDSGAPYIYAKNIIFDANGDGADHCVLQDDTIDGVLGVTFESCRFTDAADTNIRFGGNFAFNKPLTLINCEVDNANSNGIETIHPARGNQKLINTSIHDNGGFAVYIGAGLSLVQGCQIYDNGGDGINIGSAVVGELSIIGNTITRNDGDGIDFNGASDQVILFNNVVVYNGHDGGGGEYSYKFNGAVPRFFSYNLGSTNGNEDAITDAVADGAFAALYTGNNIASSQTEDQLFVTVTDGSEDFTPETGSDLIDAGTDAQSTPTIDIGAIQLDAAGGGGGGVVGVGWN